MTPVADSAVRTLPRALRWNTGGLLAHATFQFVLGVALARILGPGVFGTMATAWAALTPALILADAGLGLALVQRDRIAADEIKFCFLAQIVLGAAMAVLLCLIAGDAARFFNEPALRPVIAALSSVVVLQALGLTAMNLLRRSVNFHRLQVVQLSSAVAGQLLVALPLALLGAGVWSLVAGAIANAALASIGAYAMVRHEIGWRFGRQVLSLPAVSARFLILNLINAILGVLPAIIIGPLSGVSQLGLYDRAFALFVNPVDRAAAAISDVLFAFYSRTNERSLIQRDIFLGCLTAALFFGLPATVVVLLHGGLIIQVTLGPKWVAAAALVPPLAAFIAMLPVLQAAVPVLNGRGRPDIEFGIVAGTIIILLAGVALWSRGEIIRILWCLAAAYGFRVVCLLNAVKILLPTGFTPMAVAVIPGTVVAALTLAVNLALDRLLPATTPALLRLAVIGLVSGAVFFASWRTTRFLLPNGPMERALKGA